jgi:hypothetical protein
MKKRKTRLNTDSKEDRKEQTDKDRNTQCNTHLYKDR